MALKIVNGVYPTMITPFRKDLSIDTENLRKLVRWYEEHGINGLFAVAQSSSMFELSLKERTELAREVRLSASAEIPVIASGHISDTIEDQAEELNAIAETGVDALVLITNRFSAPDDEDKVWINRIEKLLKKIPENIQLGLYECPQPYKKILSDYLFDWVVDSERFTFLKDTCCNPSMIRYRGKRAENSSLKLFNANAPTLLMSLRHGYAGYSGIMTNFHTDLYYWLCANWEKEPEKAEKLQKYLSVSSLIENYGYPQIAKYALKKQGVPMETVSRRFDVRYREFTEYDAFLIDQFLELSDQYRKDFLQR